MPSQNGDVLELDELWSFVAKKDAGVLAVGGALPAHPPDRRLHDWRPRPGGGQSLREHVPVDYRRRATRSDFWLAYEAAFPRRTHRFCGKEEGETNHAERWFGTLRSRLSRLVRRTYSFSKSVERHLDAIHLFITGYNLAHQASNNRLNTTRLPSSS